ncbi:MAG: hypothetical protein A2X94_15890 [Bdellovibrionales bacterium GWB1_55_8]|nr:MAG: hypothetical protein A2X94_15890 [Bdellovibrionales bacterium GWB1_55_8]
MAKRANPFAIDEATREIKETRRRSKRALLNRSITQEQARSIQQANEIATRSSSLTAAETARRSRILRQAGFTDRDLERLGQWNVLKNYPGPIRAPIHFLPESAFTHTVRLKEFDKNAVRTLKTEMKDGKTPELHYVIDADDQIFLVDRKSAKGIPKEPLWVARDVEGPEARSILVKETGTVRFIDGQPRFQALHGIDLTSDELDQALTKYRNEIPDLASATGKASRAAETRVLNCLDIMSGQLAGKSFVKDSLVAGNLISIGSIGTAELLGAGRFENEKGMQVLAADILGSNANSVISGIISRSIVMSQMSMPKMVAARATVGLVTTQVQDQIYKVVLPDKDANEKAAALTKFNTWHFYLKLPLNIWIDKAMIEKLPVALFDTCRNGGVVSVALSAQSVRIYEKAASTAAYFVLRGMFVDEGNKPKGKSLIEKVQMKLIGSEKDANEKEKGPAETSPPSPIKQTTKP